MNHSEEKYRELTKVILVEDNQIHVELIRDLLEPHHYIINHFNDGRLALDYLIRNEEIDIVLMDNNLPSVNGIDIIHELHRHNNNHSIIFVTSDADINLITSAMREGALDFVIKFSPNFKEELLYVVDKVANLQLIKKKQKQAEDELKKKNEELLNNTIIQENLLKSLINSESRFKALINNMPFMAWLTDNNGNHLAVNELYANFLEIKDAEIIGKTIIEICKNEYAKSNYETNQKVIITKKKLNYEEELIINGEKHWFETYKIPNLDDNGNITGITCFSRDITEKKILEDEVLRNYAQDIILKDISSNLLNLSFSKTDDGIKDALEMIGKNIKADRGYVYLLNDDITLTNPYEWYNASNIGIYIKAEQTINRAEIKWLEDLIDQRDFLQLNDTGKMPFNSESSLAEGIKGKTGSFIIVPMKAEGNNLIGYLGFESKTKKINWKKDTRKLVVKATDIIVRALEHKKWRLTLETNEKRYRQLVENANDIIFKCDLDGNFKYLNPIVLFLAEYSECELLEMKLIDLVPSEYKDFVKNFYNDQINQKEYQSYLEFPIKTKSGKIKWLGQNVQLIEQEGVFIEFAAISRDITDRHLTQQELEFTSLRLSTIIKNLQAGLLVEDENRKIVLVNQTFCSAFGISRNADQMVGGDCVDLGLATKDLFVNPVEFVERIDNILNNREIVINEELYLKDGRVLERDYVPLILHNTYIGHFWLYRDTTERKFAEDKIRKSEERLQVALVEAEHANLSKSRFLANMSHEIRTPMNGIMGLSELLKKTTLDETQKNYIDAIISSSDNLLVIINDILDLSKINEGKLQLEKIEFRLDKLISGIVKYLDLTASDKGIDLRMIIDGKIRPVLIGDPVRINQVLINLIGNAIKFTNEGYVELSVKLLKKDKNLNYLKFIVKDTGIGIDPEKHKIIFDSFSQEDESVSRKYGGTGLGLPISKQLIEMMGGMLELKSSKGKGSEFFFTLILPDGNPDMLSAEDDEKFRTVDLSGIKILVAEDHKINQFLVNSILKNWNIIPDFAENGIIAIEKFKSNHYDIVLMDKQMPEMDGIEAARVIREDLKSQVPIIALTAAALKGSKEQMIEAGMNDFLTKPFHPEDLLNLLIKYLKLDLKEPEMLIKANFTFNTGEKLYGLESMMKMFGNDRETIVEMITMFIISTPTLWDELVQAYEQKNYLQLADIAHKLKASVDIMQINSLKQVIRDIEESGRNYDRENKLIKPY